MRRKYISLVITIFFGSIGAIIGIILGGCLYFLLSLYIEVGGGREHLGVSISSWIPVFYLFFWAVLIAILISAFSKIGKKINRKITYKKD